MRELYCSHWCTWAKGTDGEGSEKLLETLPRHGAGTAPVRKHWEERALPGHKEMEAVEEDTQNTHTHNCLTTPKWGYLCPWWQVKGNRACFVTAPNYQSDLHDLMAQWAELGHSGKSVIATPRQFLASMQALLWASSYSKELVDSSHSSTLNMI